MIKVRRFNPVEFMSSDEEIIEYLIEAYKDDPTGKTYQGALNFVTKACGLPKTFAFSFKVIKALSDSSKEESSPAARLPRAYVGATT